MRYRYLSWFFVLCFLLTCTSRSLHACRYNVRDVGFVQFGSNPYTLYGYVDRNVPQEIRESFQQITFAAMLESNIDFQLIDLDRDSKHSALDYLSPDSGNNLPSLVLVSDEGDSLPILIPNGEDSFKERLWKAVESVVSSPMREKISEDVIDSYGVIALIEGPDVSQNLRVKALAKEVIAQVESNLSSLPKKVDRPPVLHVLSQQDFVREQVFLWSLGAVLGHEIPSIAVIYGRTRRIGELLSGDEITRDSLASIVSVIGLSCECGLDRSWMMGTMIPFRWTNEYTRKMAESLGFDPENPMIKTEISQILSTSASRTQSGGSDVDDLLMGYGEIAIDFTSDEPDLLSETVSQDLGAGGSQSNVKLNPSSSEVDVSGDSTIEPSRVFSKFSLILLSIFGLFFVSLLGGVMILWRVRG